MKDRILYAAPLLWSFPLGKKHSQNTKCFLFEIFISCSSLKKAVPKTDKSQDARKLQTIKYPFKIRPIKSQKSKAANNRRSILLFSREEVDAEQHHSLFYQFTSRSRDKCFHSSNLHSRKGAASADPGCPSQNIQVFASPNGSAASSVKPLDSECYDPEIC